MRADIDAENLTIRLYNGSGEPILTAPTQGLPPEMFMGLIAEGLKTVLGRAKDPEATWKQIQSGTWRRKKWKQAPLTVRSLAQLLNKPVPEVWETWKTLPEAERRRISRIPEVMKANNVLEGRKDPDLSKFR